MKRFILAALVAAALVTGCSSWTEPEPEAAPLKREVLQKPIGIINNNAGQSFGIYPVLVSDGSLGWQAVLIQPVQVPAPAPAKIEKKEDPNGPEEKQNEKEE